MNLKTFLFIIMLLYFSHQASIPPTWTRDFKIDAGTSNNNKRIGKSCQSDERNFSKCWNKLFFSSTLCKCIIYFHSQVYLCNEFLWLRCKFTLQHNSDRILDKYHPNTNFVLQLDSDSHRYQNDRPELPIHSSWRIHKPILYFNG